MRILVTAAALVALTVPPGAQGRVGVVNALAAGEPNRDGGVGFTVRGTNPCGAVHIDLGDGTQPVVHAITELPARVSMEYSRTGTFEATARGMGNCDGSASTRVRVTSVRPAPPPPPPVPATAPPTSTTAIRFAAMDRDGNGVVTRAEWLGSARSFAVHDWNGDGRLSGDEVRLGAQPPVTRGRATSRDAFDRRIWSEDQFRLLDRNRDGRISRAEWGADLEDFYRADRNADNFLVLNEFLLATDIDDDRGDRFDYLDVNGNDRIEAAEWHGSLAAFDRIDRNGDGVLTRFEMLGSSDVPLGRPGARELARAVVVSAQRAWTDSGIDLRAGDVIDVTATGRIYYSPAAGDYADANGARSRPAPAAAPLPARDIGGLVARVGNGEPFVVGTSLASYRVETTGRLFLGVNDDLLTDNRGDFRASIAVTRR